jgi:hypothetical protein
VELDPTQIVTPRVNTVEHVTIAPDLCLSNFTYIVVWCAPALSATLPFVCHRAPHAHRLLACWWPGTEIGQAKLYRTYATCVHLLACACLLACPCLPAALHVSAVSCASTEDTASGAGAKWRRRTLGTSPCPPQRRLRAPRRLAASCWAACERMHMHWCSSDTGHVAQPGLAEVYMGPGACPVGMHVRLDFFLPTLGAIGYSAVTCG